MSYPEYETIARQAYRLWEERGRPEGRDLECWFDAEAELQRQVWSLAVPDTGPVMNNLDRALPPAERQRVRAARAGQGTPTAPAADVVHFVVVLGRGHLRIYRTRGDGRSAQFELAESFELAAGRQRYTGRDTDQAGRFGTRGGPPGGSIDERLPMQAEHERRIVAELADHLARFLADYTSATWDYAAGPALHHAVLERLPDPVRGRLGIALRKELVHQSPIDLRLHFGFET
ncbi:MAG TPA: host attachment protein [Lacunisphaera sp.]|nr:host attachment protein [Lacunisphaera sp.]